jgi:3-hydroxybutyryl-CoA dehydrogenase
MSLHLTSEPLLVVGAGIMGAGIAQVAAQAGHPVWLFDARDGAAEDAHRKLVQTLDGLAAKGKLDAQAARAAGERIRPVTSLDTVGKARLVIEAIVENLDAKRSLFAQLEARLSADTVLATNTSSISVTAIARGMKHPGRLVGMHFFNPVPLMKLVEVVSGLHTDAAVAEAIFDLSLAWGKTPVHARSTPGFIVNRIARPYYAEALALLHERAATPQAIDACLRGAGFRMGPCELMDLIGHDTNFAVTNSVYEANFFDKRYVPSLVQRELVDAGWLGRKSGHGFYRYPEGAPPLSMPAARPALHVEADLVVHGANAVADVIMAALTSALTNQALRFSRRPESNWTGLSVGSARLQLTDGRPALQVAAEEGIADVAVFDRPLRAPRGPQEPGTPLAYAVAAGAGLPWREQCAAWLAALGFMPLVMDDTPGLVVARTVAMLINEAADAVQQGVCDEAAADSAMKLGVNYPAGPFEWLAAWDACGVARVIEALDAAYRGERYRLSPGLKRRATLAGLRHP